MGHTDSKRKARNLGTKIQKESRPVHAQMDIKVHVNTYDTDLESWQEGETILALQLCAINFLGQKEYLLPKFLVSTCS